MTVSISLYRTLIALGMCLSLGSVVYAQDTIPQPVDVPIFSGQEEVTPPSLEVVHATQSDDGTYHITFSAQGGSSTTTDLTYMLELVNRTGVGTRVLVERVPFLDTFELAPFDVKNGKISYTPPSNLRGEFTLTLILKTVPGEVLAMQDVDTFTRYTPSQSPFSLLYESCALTPKGDGMQGKRDTVIEIAPSTPLVSTCMLHFIEAYGEVSPEIVTYGRENPFTPVALTYPGEENLITIDTREAHNVVTEVPTPTVPGIYTTFITYGDRSNTIAYTYEVIENMSGLQGVVNDLTNGGTRTVPFIVILPILLIGVILLLAVYQKMKKHSSGSLPPVALLFFVVATFGVADKALAVGFTLNCTPGPCSAGQVFMNFDLRSTSVTAGSPLVIDANYSSDDYPVSSDGCVLVRYRVTDTGSYTSDQESGCFTRTELTATAFRTHTLTAPSTNGTHNLCISVGITGYASPAVRCVPYTVTGGSGGTCTFSGTASWLDPGTGPCSTSFTGTIPVGDFRILTNTAAGYTGSARYTCTTGAASGGWVRSEESCTPIPTAAGACGTSNNGTFSSAPTSGLCDPGNTVTWIDNTGTDGKFNWRCSTGTAPDANCEANRSAATVSGSCGAAGGRSYPVGGSVIPIGDRCSSGTYDFASWGSDAGAWYTADSFNGNGIRSAGTEAAYYMGRYWECDGSGGGVTRGCRLYYHPECGWMHGSAARTTPPGNSSPLEKTALCTIGQASGVTTGASDYTWSCTNTGSPTANCRVARVVVPPPGNTPPSADAGPDRTITLPTTSYGPQTGTGASDAEDAPGALTKSWSQTGGPASASISGGTGLNPTFSGMTTPGTYRFTFTVTDTGGLSSSGSDIGSPSDAVLYITVDPGGPTCGGCGGGGGPGSDNVDIDATSCAIPLGGSTCSSSVTWDWIVGAVSSPRIYQGATLFAGSSEIDSKAKTATLTFGSNSFTFRDGAPTVLETATANATCASGSWDGDSCETGGGLGTITAPSCAITVAGGTSCNTTVTWSASVSVNVWRNGFIWKVADSGSDPETISYASPRTYELKRDSDDFLIQSVTASATCGSGLTWDGDSCEPSGGTHTIDAPDCTIANGRSTCGVDIDWRTTPGGVSVREDGVQFSTANSGTNVRRTLRYGANLFQIYKSGVLVASDVGTASCGGGVWDGSECVGPEGDIDANGCDVSVGGHQCSSMVDWDGSGGTRYRVRQDGILISSSPSGSRGVTLSKRDMNLFELYIDGGLAASDVPDVDCVAGSVWSPVTELCTGSGGPTATVSPVPCTIPLGASTCDLGVTWSTAGGGSVFRMRLDGATISTAPNRATPVNRTVSYGLHTHEMYIDGTARASANTMVDCASGSSWSGSSCTAAGPVPDLTAVNTFPTPGGTYALGAASTLAFNGFINNGVNPTPAGIDFWGDVEIDWNQSNCAAATADTVRYAGGPYSGVPAPWSTTLSAAPVFSAASSELRNGDHCYRMIADRGDFIEEGLSEGNNGAPWTRFTITSLPECADGIDNADPEDTLADYPNDPGCSSDSDTDETNVGGGPVIDIFTATPNPVTANSDYVLNVAATGASSCLIEKQEVGSSSWRTLAGGSGCYTLTGGSWSSVAQGYIMRATQEATLPGGGYNLGVGTNKYRATCYAGPGACTGAASTPSTFDFVINASGATAPDLISAGLFEGPGPYTVGGNIALAGRVRNIGLTTFPQRFNNDFTYRWGTAGAWLSFPGNTDRVGPLNTGEEAVDDAVFVPATSGTNLYFQHCVDSDHEITEANETPNCEVIGPFTVNSSGPAPTITRFEICDNDGVSNCALTRTVATGTPLKVVWNANDATRCDMSRGADFTTGGSTSGTDAITASALPVTTTDYQMICSGPGGITSSPVASVTTHGIRPILTASRTVVKRGETITLSWDTNNGNETLCGITGGGLTGYNPLPGGGDVETGTTGDITINGRTTFRLTCGALSDVKTIDVVGGIGET